MSSQKAGWIAILCYFVCCYSLIGLLWLFAIKREQAWLATGTPLVLNPRNKEGWSKYNCTIPNPIHIQEILPFFSLSQVDRVSVIIYRGCLYVKVKTVCSDVVNLGSFFWAETLWASLSINKKLYLYICWYPLLKYHMSATKLAAGIIYVAIVYLLCGATFNIIGSFECLASTFISHELYFDSLCSTIGSKETASFHQVYHLIVLGWVNSIQWRCWRISWKTHMWCYSWMSRGKSCAIAGNCSVRG